MGYFRKKKQVYTLLAAFLLTAVLLLSGLFIITHVKHECKGADCPVCAELEACALTLGLFSEALGTGAVIIFAYGIIIKFVHSYKTGCYLRPVSLVSLKIRLDD